MSARQEHSGLPEPEWLSQLIDRAKISLTGTPPHPKAAVLAYDDFAALADAVYILGASLYVEHLFIAACDECPDCQMQSNASGGDDWPQACRVHERHWVDVVQLKRAALAVWLTGVNRDDSRDI